MTDYSNQAIDIQSLPKAAEVELQPLHPKYPFSVFIRSLLFQFIIVLAATIASLRFNLPSILWFVVAVEVGLSIIWPYYAAKACRFALREHDIIFKQGLWLQKTTAVSFNRIQHIDISHDPLERHFKLATIKLFTAGGNAADLKIAGLPDSTAQQIRQQILLQLSEQRADMENIDE